MNHPLIEPLEARIAPATFSIAAPAGPFTEGDSGTKEMIFTVTLTGAITSDATVHFATADGPLLPVNTAAKVSDGDYLATSGTLTFRPGETEQFIRVVVNGDGKREQDERLFVRLDTPTGEGTLGTASATGTITNDDPVPTVTITGATLVEGSAGESNMEFTLTLSNPVSTSVAVLAVTADGTAKAGEDYVAVIDDANIPPVVFAAGTTTAKLTVKISGDTTFEPTERFFVNLLQNSPRTTGVLVGTPQVEGTITNDDAPPAANVRVDDVQVVEGSSGTKQAVFTVTLSSGPLVGDVTVQAATGGGTATAGTDYTAVASTTLTFHPGETTKQIFVPIVGDAVVEPNETFFLNLSDNSTNAVISRAQGTGSIIADDAALQVTDVQIFEGGSGGTTQAVFTVTLENPPATGDVTVKVNTANGTATAGTDYTAVTERTLTFRPGQPSIEVLVPIIGDSTSEANKTFLVNLTEPSVNAAIGRGAATGTILNDDGVVFSINDVAVTEGNIGSSNAIFLVRLLNPQSSPVSVNVTTEPGTASTADFTFTPATQTLTFAANETQKLVSIAIVGDLIRESAETFVVRLSNAPVGATFAKDAGIGTILDNNDPLPTLSLGNGMVVEGNSGTSFMQFTATLSQPASETVTAAYSTRDLAAAVRPALAGADYTAVVDGLVTFAAGQTSVLISVPILGDAVNESDETFGVRLSAANGAVLGTADAVGTIQNDEVTVSIAPRSQAEGSGGTTTYFFDVQLTAPGSVLTEAVTVNFETRDGTAISTGASKDFTAANGTLTFQPGGNLLQQIAITVAGDSRLENAEQFFVNLVSSVNAAISVTQGVGTIQNDDQARISIEDPAAFTEGNSPTSAMTFKVKLENPSDLPVTFLVNTVNGTALASVGATTLNDFTGIVDQSFTFAAGEVEKTVTVNVVGDTTDELKTETFSVEIKKPTTPLQNDVVIDRASASGAIIDDDLRILSVTDKSVVEGDAGTTTITFTVRLSSASTQDAGVSFFYSTQDSTATAGQDYVGISALQATIPKGQTSVPVSVTVNGDTASEVNEQFKLMIFGSLNAEIVEGADSATGTIVDDEGGGARLELVPVAGASFGEADRVVEFDVVRSGNNARAVTVQYETVDFTARSTGTGITDFVAKSGTITFAAGSNTASEKIRIRIIGDINFENDETFQVRLFNPVNAAVLSEGNPADESSTAVTIRDDGDQAPTLSVADASIVEGNAGTQQQLIFKVRLSAANEKGPVTVKAATAVGTDAATNANPTSGLSNQAQDYLPGAVGGVTLTFATGDFEEDFAVTINGDARDESDEEFFRVLLSGESGAAVSRAEAKGTITDNDAAPTLTFSGTALQTTEGNGGQTNATFRVTLSEVSERPVSIRVTTQAGTAVSGADFEAVNTEFFYTPGSAASDGISFIVPIIADVLDEVDETFGVTVSGAEFGQLRRGSANVDSASLTATILDDDAPPVVFVSDANIIEGDAGIREMIFTVALSAASGKAVDVNFATEDGTAFSVGPMEDFVARTGALNFAPGEIQKEVRVVINGDTFREQIETFGLRISGPVNATILTATGTGTVLTDGDTTVGIGIRNAFRVEGDSGQPTINFTVELSDTLAGATTFNAVATSGSAGRGSDFVPLGITPFTIAAGATTTPVPVTLNGDATFEATESFFVDLRNVVNAGATLTIAGGAARGTIFNDDLRRVDSRTVQFIDVDGDLATVHISRGALSDARLSFGAPNGIGGRQLQSINLTGDNLQFQDADLSVTAVAQPGFNGDASGVKGNGFVNVGAILAATQAGVLQFANGIDLGTVNIDGDLGRIHIGDSTVDAAIKNLVVRSMGRFGTTTQGTGGGADTLSRVLGPIDSFRVFGNFQATLQIVGAQFGIIRNLQIDGALLGGTADNSGSIFFTGRIDNAQIGRVAGGDGDVSGSLRSLLNANSRISNLHVVGEFAGGAGDNSGNIVAPEIGSVRIGSLVGGDGVSSGQIFGNTINRVVVVRDVVGGAGNNSGQIFGSDLLGTARILGQIRGGDGDNSAFVGSNERIGTVTTVGSVLGGDGDDSGTIRSGSHINLLSIGGNVRGGLGNRSGGVDVGGKLFNGVITGSILGGDSNVSTALVGSGFLFAHRIDHLTVGGDVVAGVDGGGGLALSGTIRSETTIDTLRIRGDVTGSATIAAIIAAPGDTSAPAFRSLIIDGDARFAEILAGYSVNATVANPRGGEVNADAQIGSVRIVGALDSTSIIAGAAAGTDRIFGTNDDLGISGAGTTNAAGTVSKIARIIVGSVTAAIPTTRLSGIGAQFVESLSVNGSAFSLEPQPGNDLRRELAVGSRVNVFELPVV